jgi:hypothetical protein
MSSSSLSSAPRYSQDAFLLKIDSEIDLPAMGNAVARVVQLTSSDEEAVMI